MRPILLKKKILHLWTKTISPQDDKTFIYKYSFLSLKVYIFWQENPSSYCFNVI